MAELKPCPFCGGKAKIMMLDENGFDAVDIVEIGNGVDDTNDTYICCKKCDVQSSLNESASSAIAAWNKRTSVMPENEIQYEVIESIITERERQGVKWGEQNHPLEFWTGILGEEYGELCQAINETVFDNGAKERKKGGYENMKKEAIHVAAVAVNFLECLERHKELILYLYRNRG